MFCSFCQVARVENEAPCPNCGAPSPLLSSSQGNGGKPAPSANNQWKPQMPQQHFGSPGMPLSAWPQQAAFESQAQPQFWSHVSLPPEAQAQPQQSWPQQSFAQMPQQQSIAQISPSQEDQQPLPPWQQGPAASQTAQAWNVQAQSDQKQSLLPVLYQGSIQNAPQGNTQQLITLQNLEHLLPAIPEEENTVYVPPMYTKPRPIIPRYRIISGFLSVLIVSLLLCGGMGYYAKSTGKLTWIKNMVGLATPPAPRVIPTPNIPDPPNTIDKGPAFSTISSATTTSRIDEHTHIALQTQKIFQVKQVFFVTYSVVNPGKDGTVTVKWYMNNMPFTSATSKPIKAKTAVNGSARMSYSVPASGKVEIYWNDQLAIRLYFAVR